MNKENCALKLVDKMYIGLRVKCPLFLSDFNDTCILLTDSPKILKYKFHENA